MGDDGGGMEVDWGGGEGTGWEGGEREVVQREVFEREVVEREAAATLTRHSCHSRHKLREISSDAH